MQLPSNQVVDLIRHAVALDDKKTVETLSLLTQKATSTLHELNVRMSQQERRIADVSIVAN